MVGGHDCHSGSMFRECIQIGQGHDEQLQCVVDCCDMSGFAKNETWWGRGRGSSREDRNNGLEEGRV